MEKYFLLNSHRCSSLFEIVNMPGSTVISEIEMLSHLKSLSPRQLRDMDFSSREISELKEKDVKSLLINSSADKSVADLKQLGLSESEILAIKNHQYELIDDNTLRALNASLAFNIASTSRSGNSANYVIYWHWSAPTNLKFKDTIATSISDNYYLTGQSTCKLTYVDKAGMAGSYTTRISPSSYQGPGGTFQFDMSRAAPQGPKYCKAGKAFIATAGPTSPSHQLNAVANYFHSWKPEAVNVSINIGYISFSGGSGYIAGESSIYF